MTRRAFSAAFASALCAQDETGSLEGRIVDDAGKPVPDAAVKAQHTVRQNTHTATSGADGRYRLAAMPGGVYNLYVARPGYCSVWIRHVVVRPAHKNERDVNLPSDAACQPGTPKRRGK